MAKIISVHSFRGGTGKSNVTANLAALLAAQGRRVAVVDTDIQSPGIYTLFGLADGEAAHTLNDFLWGTCEIAQAAVDVTDRLGSGAAGQLFLVPASNKMEDITRVLREGYAPEKLKDGLRRLSQALKLDAVFVDTHPGLNEETLYAIAMSGALLVLLRPDQQDYHGTGVTLALARKLRVPQLWLILNKLPAAYDAATVRQRLEGVYGAEVAAVLPHCEELMTLASEGLFTLRYPDHLVTRSLQQVAARLLD